MFARRKQEKKFRAFHFFLGKGGISTFDVLYYSIFFINVKHIHYFFYEQSESAQAT